MISSKKMPGILLGGGSGGNPAGLSNPSQLEVAYQNLLTGAADIIAGTGTRILEMTAGAIGTAGSIQIGNTETASEVAQNLTVLNEIADFCNANGIKIDVLAVLTNAATYGTGPTAINALVDQWATAAAKANLPIISVTDIQEIGISQPKTSFSTYAKIEVNAVETLIKDYAGSSYKLTASNLAVGDMEGGDVSNLDGIGQWWTTFDAAAETVGISGFSTLTTDTGWFAPWLNSESVPTWQASLTGIATLAAAHHMTVNVTIQGTETDTSSNQSIMQAEQNAISLAKLQGAGLINVDNLTLQTWGTRPTGVGQISSPTSTVSEAAQINAVYPLYEAGLITAQGNITLGAPGQILVNTAMTTPITSLTVKWNASDVQAGNRLGVVLIDQTGVLHATPKGGGTVFNQANNVLILTGNADDLASELSSITLNETNAGPDTIDVETYGSAGRLSDSQICVLAARPGQSVDVMASTSSKQGWVQSRAMLNAGTVLASGAVMVSDTLYWNTTGTLAGTVLPNQPAFVNIVSIHEPLAEYGIAATSNGVVDIYNSAVDNGAFPSNGYANNPGVNNVVAPIRCRIATDSLNRGIDREHV